MHGMLLRVCNTSALACVRRCAARLAGLPNTWQLDCSFVRLSATCCLGYHSGVYGSEVSRTRIPSTPFPIPRPALRPSLNFVQKQSQLTREIK